MQIGELVEEGLASPDQQAQDLAIDIMSLVEKLDERLDRAARPTLRLVSSCRAV